MRTDTEVKVVDGFEKRKVGAACAGQVRLLAMGDLFSREEREEIAIGPGFLLGAGDEIAPHPPRIREVQAFEERVEILIGGS